MGRTVRYGQFEWDLEKEETNLRKHGLLFADAIQAFLDHDRVIKRDAKHSEKEERLYCFGLVKGHVAMVRYVHRGEWIRIVGAGYWKKGRLLYEKEKSTGKEKHL